MTRRSKKPKTSKTSEEKKTESVSLREKTPWQYFLDLCAIFGLFISLIALLVQILIKPPPALAPPDLRLQIGSLPLYQDENIPIFLGIENFSKGAAYLGIFPLVLHNAGQSTIRDISVVSQFPKTSREGLLHLLETHTEGLLRKQMKIIMDFQEIGHLSVHMANVDYINPGINVAVDQPFFLFPTQIDFDIEPLGGLRVPVHIEYSWIVEYFVNAANAPQTNYRTTISIQKTGDKDSISNDAAGFIKEQIKDDLSNRPWIERIVSTQEGHAIIGFTKPKLHGKTELGDLYEVRFESPDFRILTITLEPKWPKYALWLAIPALALIICLRLRILHMIFARQRHNV